jgi:hypothetical protein
MYILRRDSLTKLKGLKMNIPAKLYLFIIICILFTNCIQADDANNLDVEQNSDVSIAITHFEVTDANLELGWKITNNTDHDVWICDTINAYNPNYKQFEVYMPENNQTLLIRRRLDVPSVLV